MAHVKLWRDDDGAHIEINGVDFTNELFTNTLRLVTSVDRGDDAEFAEVALELKIPVSRLDLGEHEDVDAALLVGDSLARMAEPVPPL